METRVGDEHLAVLLRRVPRTFPGCAGTHRVRAGPDHSHMVVLHPRVHDGQAWNQHLLRPEKEAVCP